MSENNIGELLTEDKRLKPHATAMEEKSKFPLRLPLGEEIDV